MEIRDWGGRPYHALDWELRTRFGHKLYKLSLESGMSCPNRDGRLGYGGCIFCSAGGSGDFAAPFTGDIAGQIEAAKARVSRKLPADRRDGPSYIAYFQSYTNTYAPAEHLETLFEAAVRHPDIAVLSIATRPDCLEPEKVRLLERLNRIKPVWVELGLQTIHPQTAALIRRGYELPVFESALMRLKQAGLTVIVHLILGLPGESREMMLQSVRWLAKRPIDGIKLQLLHVLKGTALEELFLRDPFPLPAMEQYIDLVIDCLELLPPSVTVHRLTGDGPKRLLIAPLWSADKKRVLNRLQARLRERGSFQGRLYSSTPSSVTETP